MKPQSAWAGRLDYAGTYERQLSALVDRGTGNGGSRLSAINFALDALSEPGRIFHPMCGTGRWADALRRRAHSDCYVGLDISEQSIATARERDLPAATFLHGDVLKDWPQEAYGAETVLWTFEALNYFPPELAAALIDRVGLMPHVRQVLIELSWPFPPVRPRLKGRIARDHTLGSGIGIEIHWRRPIHGTGVGFTDAICVAGPRLGLRRIRSSLWLHTPEFAHAAFYAHRFTQTRNAATPSGDRLLIFERYTQ